MSCRETTAELVECARGQGSPNRELRAHMAACSACRERWEAERQLSAHLNLMRACSSAVAPADGNKAALMREFATYQRTKKKPLWAWPLAAAAAVVFAMAIGHETGVMQHRHRPVNSTSAHFAGADTVLYEVSSYPGEFAGDSFVQVPYTPPVATGEMIRMIHTEMVPEALASMGVDVDPSWTENVPVDVAVGEDGLPHAIRISDSN